MAGEAVTGRFMLGTATVMIGLMANLPTMGVADSLGLAKNVTLKSTPKFTELSQGVKNSLVASVMTGNDLKITGEIFEYTAKNLAYALGLDGSTFTQVAVSTPLTTAYTNGVLLAATGATTAFVAGQWVAIHVNAMDQIFIRKVVSIVAATSITINAAIPVPAPLGSVIRVVNMVPAGSRLDQPYLAAKLVGQLADGSWTTVLIGKIRVTSGLSMAFKTDNFDNMPFELTSYDLVPTDANYALFTDAVTGDVVKAMIFSSPTA